MVTQKNALVLKRYMLQYLQIKCCDVCNSVLSGLGKKCVCVCVCVCV